MNRVRHVLLVLFAAAAAMASEAPDAQRPSLFARTPTPVVAIVATPSPTILPTSPHIRARIKSLVEATPAPPPLLARVSVATADTEAIAMAPFVVTERPLRLKMAAPKNSLLEAVRTGYLWRIGNADVVSLGKVGAGGHARITFGISIDF